MLYILCEDSGSGKILYKQLNQIYLMGKAIVTSVYGVNNFCEKYNKDILNRITSSDVLFIAIDNVEDSAVSDTLTFFMNESAKMGFRLVCSQYYCIEEVFLSYKYFCKFLSIDPMIEKQYYRPVYDVIKAQYILKNNTNVPNYFSFNYIKNWISTTGNSKRNYPTTREQMAAKLLSRLSEGSNDAFRKKFQVNKGDIGYCWFSDCDSQHPNSCAKVLCSLNENKKRMDSLSKLRVFWDNTLLPYQNMSLSDMKNLVK